MKVRLLEPIEGFEDVVEIRRPRKGERYYSIATCVVARAIDDHPPFEPRQLVLTPIKRWRAATLEDGIRAIRGETIIARFRNWSTEDWHKGKLATVWPEPGGTRWGKRGDCSYLLCEVLND